MADEREYYRRRAAEEARAAEAAMTGEARSVHRQLAAKYEAMIAAPAQEPAPAAACE